MSSSDPITENATDSKPPSEKLGDSSPELGDSNSSEKLGDSSTVWIDPVESDQPKEEKGECGFCVFMKEGGCKESFTAWEVCLEEAKKNKEDISKCMDVTSTLMKCMDAHSEYYQEYLAAEKDAVKKEFEAEKNKVEEEVSEEELAARKQAQG